MAEYVAEAGENLQIWRVHLDELREQDVNARTMAPEVFDRLSANIKSESRLESLPLTVKREGCFEIISGHHRTRAARAAGVMEILVLADTRDLDRSQVVAKQLAHNLIDGQDDPEILERLAAEMKRIDDIIESFVQPDALDVPTADPESIAALAVEFPVRYVTVSFLPKQFEEFRDICETMKDAQDLIGAADEAVFEKFREAILELGKAEDIRNIGAVLAKMTEITQEHLAAKEV